MNIIQIILLAAIICVIAPLLSSHGSASQYLILCGALIILIFAVGEFTGIYSFITELNRNASISSAYGGIVFKAIGICILSEFAVSVCNDLHYEVLTSAVEFGTRCSILVLALPIFEDVIEIIKELLQ